MTLKRLGAFRVLALLCLAARPGSAQAPPEKPAAPAWNGHPPPREFGSYDTRPR